MVWNILSYISNYITGIQYQAKQQGAQVTLKEKKLMTLVLMHNM